MTGSRVLTLLDATVLFRTRQVFPEQELHCHAIAACDWNRANLPFGVNRAEWLRVGGT